MINTISRNRNLGLIAALLGLGVGLQFMGLLLDDRLFLRDELFFTSMPEPWWVILQIALLAGLLRLFRDSSDTWSLMSRRTFAIACAVLIMLLRPELVTQIFTPSASLHIDVSAIEFLWHLPLALYVLSATLMVFGWLQREKGISLACLLGYGVVIVSVLTFPFVLWMGQLWDMYVQPSGR